MGKVKNEKPVIVIDSAASLKLMDKKAKIKESLLIKKELINLKVEELYTKHLENVENLKNKFQIRDLIYKTNQLNQINNKLDEIEKEIKLIEEGKIEKKNFLDLFKRKKDVIYYSENESKLLQYVFKHKIEKLNQSLEETTNEYITLGEKISKFDEVISYDEEVVKRKQDRLLKKIKRSKNDVKIAEYEKQYKALLVNKFDPKDTFIRRAKKKHNVKKLFKASKKINLLKTRIQRNNVRISKAEVLKLEKLNSIQSFKKAFNSLNYKQQKVIFGILFLLPWVVGFCIFFATPLARTIWWSLNEMTVKEGGGFNFAFSGFQNYRNLFTNVTLMGITFTEMLTTSILNIAINLPVIVIFSLLIAVILNTKFKGHQLVKAIFFIPVVFNMSVINNTLNGVFGQMMDAEIGQGFVLSEQFGSFLFRIGIGNGLVEFLISAVDRIFTIVNMSGIQILMFIAGLQSIPNHLYEAAKVEGATKYEMFWKITIPMVSPIILTSVVYTVVDSFASSQIMQYLTVNSQGTSLANNQPGLYSAIAIIYFLANALIIVFVFVILKKLVFYYDE